MDGHGRVATPAPPVVAFEIDRLLQSIDRALEIGDICIARSLIDEARRVTSTELTEPRPRLRVVGNGELTDREMATLRLLPDGSMSQKDIARELNVTRNTVKTHLRSLYRKLDVHGRGEAIRRAREMGLLEPPLSAPIPISRHGGDRTGPSGRA